MDSHNIELEQFLNKDENCQDLILLLENMACENYACSCVYDTPFNIDETGKLFRNDLSALVEWLGEGEYEFNCVFSEIKELITRNITNNE
jgi:hypothetical protein